MDPRALGLTRPVPAGRSSNTHLKRSKKTHRHSIRIFTVTHRSEPAVLDNTEEYLEKATSWLRDASISPDGISAPGSRGAGR